MQAVKSQMLRFMEEQQFPSEAISSLTNAIDSIFATKGKDIVAKIIKEYQADYHIKPDEIAQKSKTVSEISSVDEKQCNLIIYMALVDGLKKHYINKGYPIENYNDTIKELRCKLLECHDCFGVWGMRACAVSNTHFALTRFGMGLFQFEIIKFGKTAIVDGVELKPDDKVINIHIPRLGLPLTKQERQKSYLRAKEFFKAYFPNQDKLPFFCHTWLLFKKHKEMLKPSSNIVSFIDDFTWLEGYEYQDYNETWRIFGKFFTSIEDMPKENSIQKAYATIIERGEKTGGAEGVFFL